MCSLCVISVISQLVGKAWTLTVPVLEHYLLLTFSVYNYTLTSVKILQQELERYKSGKLSALEHIPSSLSLQEKSASAKDDTVIGHNGRET